MPSLSEMASTPRSGGVQNTKPAQGGGISLSQMASAPKGQTQPIVPNAKGLNTLSGMTSSVFNLPKPAPIQQKQIDTNWKSSPVVAQQTKVDIWKSIVNYIKEIPRSAYEQYKNPSESTKKVESIYGLNTPKDKKLAIISFPLRTIAKGFVRTFSPMLESYADDIGQAIATNDIAKQVGEGKLPVEALDDLTALKKSNLQLIGDATQVALALRVPGFFKEAVAGSGGGVVKSMLTGGLKQLPTGAVFGTAGVLSSGTKDPGEIAKVVSQSMITLGILGVATGGGSAILKNIARVKPKIKSPEVRSALDGIERGIRERQTKVFYPEKISGKLEVGKTIDPLLTEARKYKSAEEFVKAQTNAYHGTNGDFETFKPFNKVPAEFKDSSGQHTFGTYFADNKDLAGQFGKNILERKLNVGKPFDVSGVGSFDELVKKLGLNTEKNAWEIRNMKSTSYFDKLGGESESSYRALEALNKKFDVVKQLKKQGYDALIFADKENGITGKTTVVFDPKNILTKSQLTDIWKQAHKGSNTPIDVSQHSAILEEFAKAQKYKTSDEITNLGNDIPKTHGDSLFVREKVNLNDLSQTDRFDVGEYKQPYFRDMFRDVRKGAELPPIVVDKNGSIIDGNHRLEAYLKSGKDYQYVYKEVPQTKSQLTDIWEKAQEIPKLETPKATPKPVEIKEMPKTKAVELKEQPKVTTPSKIGKSIEVKAVEAKLTKGFKDVAGYEKMNIADQAKRATDVVKNNLEVARAIVRGEKPLPEGLHGTSLITAMEEYIKAHPSTDLAYELANSRLISETSVAAQELRLAAERTPDSATAKIIEIKKAREAKVKALETRRTVERKSIKKETAKLNLPKEELSFNKFLDKITC
jgi:hypothetical protein